MTLTLSHEAIAHLVGGRRPTVSGALARLADHELIARRDGTWLLVDESRALLNTAPAPRPTLGIGSLGGGTPAPN
jgi:hypothetical protein